MKVTDKKVFEVLSFKENDGRRLQFLTGLEEAISVPFHWDYSKKIDAVCRLFMGEKTCGHCDRPTDGMKERVRYGFYVYDLDREKIGVICSLDSYNALLPILCDLDDEIGLKNNTFLVDRTGYAKDSAFFGMPIDNVFPDIVELEEATEENLKHSIFEFWEGIVNKKV